MSICVCSKPAGDFMHKDHQNSCTTFDMSMSLFAWHALIFKQNTHPEGTFLQSHWIYAGIMALVLMAAERRWHGRRMLHICAFSEWVWHQDQLTNLLSEYVDQNVMHYSGIELGIYRMKGQKVCKTPALAAELGDIRSIAGRLQEAMGPAICAIHLRDAPASVDVEQQGRWRAAGQADTRECHDLRYSQACVTSSPPPPPPLPCLIDCCTLDIARRRLTNQHISCPGRCYCCVEDRPALLDASTWSDCRMSRCIPWQCCSCVNKHKQTWLHVCNLRGSL